MKPFHTGKKPGGDSRLFFYHELTVSGAFLFHAPVISYSV